jgi:hypothetical protein
MKTFGETGELPKAQLGTILPGEDESIEENEFAGMDWAYPNYYKFAASEFAPKEEATGDLSGITAGDESIITRGENVLIGDGLDSEKVFDNGLDEVTGDVGEKSKIGQFMEDKNITGGKVVDQLGNLFDVGRGIYGMLKKDKPVVKVDAQTVNPAFLDPTRAIQEVQTGYNAAADAISEGKLGIATSTAARLALAGKEAGSVADVTERFANINAGIFNQANMFNAQAVNRASQLNRQEINYKEMINQQERDRAADMFSHGLKDFARTSQVHRRDENAALVQDQIIELMGTSNFEMEKQPDGNYLVVTRSTSGETEQYMVDLSTNTKTRVN